ncbi:MAG: pyridoxamine 5'-phosphate oxidase [Betaproteobacteria bacterium]
MPRYVAFLRGVNPMNANMAELKRCFENAGYANVRTVLASGNVVFDARAQAEDALARAIERALAQQLGRGFYTIVRPASTLRALIEANPYARFRLPANAKRVVTFLGEPHRTKLALPLESDGARILARTEREVFTAYVPNPRGPVFMTLIERTFGKNVTTRTWETVQRCAAA